MGVRFSPRPLLDIYIYKCYTILMNTTSNNKIIFGFKILSILAFSLLIIPAKVFATAGYVDNPTPYIASISPDSSNSNIGSNVVITITGDGFVPGSKARVNGSDRMTTFIDYSHLLIRLNSNDTYNTNGIYINIFNGFPGGGYSNAKLFTINNGAPITNTNNTYSNTNTNQAENATTTKDTNSNSSNLASAAIFGSTGFLPSGLMQWILFAIIILLIVILARRFFGADAKYNQAPMKHS